MRKLEMDELGRMSIEDYKKSEKTPIVLVLDNIRSMNNVGAAFRSSDAFRIQKIILCGITAKPPHRDINKTALGADQSVDWEYFETVSEALISLKESGFEIVGIEQMDHSQKLNEFNIKSDQKYALVFGNEAFGISDEALEHLDSAIEIPQFGTKHSLNVSVAIGIVLWNSQNQLLITKYKL